MTKQILVAACIDLSCVTVYIVAKVDYDFFLSTYIDSMAFSHGIQVVSPVEAFSSTNFSLVSGISFPLPCFSFMCFCA